MTRRLVWWLLPSNGRRRWRIADRLGDHTRACWADLVDWAMADPDDEKTLLGAFPGGRQCRREAEAGLTSCYCGKFNTARDQQAQADYEARKATRP